MNSTKALDMLTKIADYHEQIITDEASTTVTYVGYAQSGVATSAARWIIKKITATNATSPQGVITILYATSYNNATNIWDNRASLSYTS